MSEWVLTADCATLASNQDLGAYVHLMYIAYRCNPGVSRWVVLFIGLRLRRQGGVVEVVWPTVMMYVHTLLVYPLLRTLAFSFDAFS